MEEALKQSYEALGLMPDASLREVEQAFNNLRALYGEDSLATYSLLEYADRQEKLDSLQSAYEQILSKKLIKREEPVKSEAEPIICVLPPAEVSADPEKAPGVYLKELREVRGMTLRDVAERTKVGSFHLECIEQERFDRLPAPVYLRGFIREFARAVGAEDTDVLVDVLLERYRAKVGE
jgi:flagellar biosynthesis protein FlhG